MGGQAGGFLSDSCASACRPFEMTASNTLIKL